MSERERKVLGEVLRELREYFELKDRLDGPLGGLREYDELERREARLRQMVRWLKTPAVMGIGETEIDG